MPPGYFNQLPVSFDLSSYRDSSDSLEITGFSPAVAVNPIPVIHTVHLRLHAPG